jgi:PKD repeat protein
MRTVLIVALGIALSLFVGCDGSEPDPENQGPSADFSFSPQAPRVGEPVTFTADASDPDGTIVVYDWNFDGDANPTRDATGEIATYTYGQSGTFRVTLNVNDDDGAFASANRIIDVAE